MEESGASLDWCVGINMLENVRLRGSGSVHELSQMCPACRILKTVSGLLGHHGNH